MTRRDDQFLANSGSVRGTITRFEIVRHELRDDRRAITITVALEWVLKEGLDPGGDSAMSTTWRVTIYGRRTDGPSTVLAVADSSAADVHHERTEAGHEHRFALHVLAELPTDAPIPLLEATIRRQEDVARSPSGDMLGYVTGPDLDPAFEEASPFIARWLRGEAVVTSFKVPRSPADKPTPAPAGAEPEPEAIVFADNPEPAEVSVFYATDRQPILDAGLQTVDYGARRGFDLQYGIATVTIPRDHRRGCIERPQILKLQFREDANLHIVVKEVVPASEESFLTQFIEELNRTNRREAFLFIHGFNVTFAEACRRTAQLGYDLQSFVPVLFSWPSQGTVIDYLADTTAIQWCRPHLEQFVALLLQRSNVRALHLIGHSMGTQVLASLARDFVGRDRVREIVLAAPDIDRNIFEQQIAPALAGGRVRTTLYTSSTDQALRLSKKANRGYPRLGDCEDGVCVVPGVDTIDVTAVSRSMLGLNHSTVFDVRTMVEDLHRLMDNGTPVERRGLSQRESPLGRYWAVQA